MTGQDSIEALVVWLLDHPGLEVPDIEVPSEPQEEEDEDIQLQPVKSIKPEVVSQEDSDYDFSSQSSEDSDPFEFELPGSSMHPPYALRNIIFLFNRRTKDLQNTSTIPRH